MRVNDGFKLSTAATEIALNNRRLVENPENFGGQNQLLSLAARHVWHTAPLNDAQIQPALCVKKPDPLAWFWVSFSICEISLLDRVISTLKRFVNKSGYDRLLFSGSKRSEIVNICLLFNTNWSEQGSMRLKATGFTLPLLSCLQRLFISESVGT